jgi:uncharacterized ferredoxin-like protein
MSISDEKKLTHDVLREVAAMMVIAARTAPKARGNRYFRDYDCRRGNS